ncbi:hypothetical protein EC957_004937 [Mortierella hygrophila]|uniref:Uncharacterized protein n=1 Tax=Mortierella hygrophila TaxID=979708 RepID=A0A9P6F1U2_9FUNG|nr:hypothetical protein EC957_004937 [Mortierella hygrophila]
MSDNANANVTTGPPRRLSLSEKIAEKFSALKGRRTSHHNDHSQQSDQNQQKHQYGTNENAHDSAFAVEGSMVGAHAIPPIGLEHRYQGNAAQQTQSGQAQAQTQSQAPVQTHADQQQTSEGLMDSTDRPLM